MATAAHIAHVLLGIRTQVKIYHWNTFSYARHKASDDLTSSLDDHIDTFMEVYIGKYERPRYDSNMKISMRNYDDEKMRTFIQDCIKWFMTDLPKMLNPSVDTDLLNLRDEIVGDLNKILYLFSLK